MWPQFILNSFARIHAEADESAYYGVWNSVLNFCFKIEEGYEITPHNVVGPISPWGQHPFDSLVSYTVTKNDATIFFVEIKARKYLPGLYARQEADVQMRKRFTQLYDSSPSIMHGVSAFGTRMCFYRLDRDTGRIAGPRAAAPSADFVVDTAPLELWDDSDICEPDGYERFMKSVDKAKRVGKRLTFGAGDATGQTRTYTLC
ncbi:hypothetical protein FPV67DRAFT_1467838 [Lyophyllum atratum]|nr:hypothetical protein FPV67DRAFT_1467838 [Lyophyllum atratum]